MHSPLQLQKSHTRDAPDAATHYQFYLAWQKKLQLKETCFAKSCIQAGNHCVGCMSMERSFLTFSWSVCKSIDLKPMSVAAVAGFPESD